MTIGTQTLSKSGFLHGLQCSKLLWINYNAKGRIPPPDVQDQAIFDQGQEVGNLAKKLFPDGIVIGQGVADTDEVLRLTHEAIKLRRPLFEAAFSYQGGIAKADILNPVENHAWDLIEVKSSTSIKNVYISDMAFQAFVFTGGGLNIRRCFLMLINPDFVKHGEVDLDHRCAAKPPVRIKQHGSSVRGWVSVDFPSVKNPKAWRIEVFEFFTIDFPAGEEHPADLPSDVQNYGDRKVPLYYRSHFCVKREFLIFLNYD